MVRKYLCKVCGRPTALSGHLGVCRDCIVHNFELAKEYIFEAHKKSREPYGLPYPAPSGGSFQCNLCSHNCSFRVGDRSFCGLRFRGPTGFSQSVSGDYARAYVYLDPHVTNCTSAWFCPAATGLGYPRFAVRPRAEIGFYNLAVFFYGCNFNCLYCQNYEHKDIDSAPRISRQELVDMALSNEKITCICYFGGSPEPHFPFVLRVNRDIVEKKGRRILRICYEWNGAGNSLLVKKAAEYSFITGGIVKFDLKAPPGSPLSLALSGVDNKIVYRNFELVFREFWGESEVPILSAATLLVPGYIMPEDVREIAEFIASLDPDIPYTLLVFHPAWMMDDLPITPRKIVKLAELEARKYLRNVYIGNKFLLSVAPETL